MTDFAAWNAHVYRVRLALDLYERLFALVGQASPDYWPLCGELWHHLSHLDNDGG